MFKTAARQLRIYAAFAAMVPKLFLAYSIWVWMHFFVSVVALVVLVSFWTAVYASGDQAAIGGLQVEQTLNYIILAQIFLPAVHSTDTILYFGSLMRQGQVGIELLRPVDFQVATYVRSIAEVGAAFMTQIPLVIVGWLMYRFQLPTDPKIWGAFLLSVILGSAVVFCFDWILSCMAFYSTEVWGLNTLRFSIATFFSGALLPVDIMPDWLQQITMALPFSYALYVPVSLLSGITPLGEMPRIWLIEAGYLVVLVILSRLVFRISVRKVTVQGG